MFITNKPLTSALRNAPSQCIVTIVGMHKAGVTHNDVKPHNIVVKHKGPEFAEIMGTPFECTFVDLGCATYNDVREDCCEQDSRPAL